MISKYQEQLWHQIANYQPTNGKPLAMTDRIRSAFFETPRHNYIERFRTMAELTSGPTRSVSDEQNLELIYRNEPLMYVDDQDNILLASSSEPAFIFHLLRALDVQPNQSVLEIGCGTGWLLAVLSNIAGSNGKVTGVETVPFLASIARDRLRNDATVLTGDGLSVEYDERKFDRVIFTASTFSFPTILFDIVGDHGKIILPLQNRGPAEEVHLLERNGDEFQSIQRWVSKFVPLISNHADYTGSFVPIEGCEIYEKLVSKPISSREFTMGAAPDSNDLMMRMLPFSSYLSKMEPNFRALSWGSDLGRGGSFQSAVFGSKEATCYLVFNEQETSMAVWHNGKLTSYGTSEAEELFLKHMRDWTGLGYPMGSAFGLTVSKKPSHDDSSHVEIRNDVYLSWRPPNAHKQ